MNTNEFNNILHGECANCRKSFGDKNKNEMEWSTTLDLPLLPNMGFLSPPEDLTNFLALCYVYKVPPIRFENSIKKYVMNFIKQTSTEFHALEETDENEGLEDPLSSLDLALCQTCSITLGELYTVFYKFEQLSKKDSVISKGFQHSKEHFDLHEDFKLNKLSETETMVQGSPNNLDTFVQSTIENSQDLHNLQEFSLIKEELVLSDIPEPTEFKLIREELDSLSECSFNLNSINEGEHINNQAEEQGMNGNYEEAENWNHHSSFEKSAHSSKGSTRKRAKESELLTTDCTINDTLNLVAFKKHLPTKDSKWSGSKDANKSTSKTGPSSIDPDTNIKKSKPKRRKTGKGLTVKKYSCQDCGKKFAYLNGMKCHKKDFHSGIELRCLICNRQFFREEYLKRHSRVCELNKMMEEKDLENMINREQTPTDEPGSSIDQSVKNRNPEKPKATPKKQTYKEYVCQTCDTKFASLNGMKRHKKDFHSGIDFSCLTCNKKFTREEYLKRHSRICALNKLMEAKQEIC